jgi:hypothetical protein
MADYLIDSIADYLVDLMARTKAWAASSWIICQSQLSVNGYLPKALSYSFCHKNSSLKPPILPSSQFKTSNEMEFSYEERRSYIIQPRDLYDHGPNSMMEMELGLRSYSEVWWREHAFLSRPYHWNARKPKMPKRLYQTVEMIRDYSRRLFESIIRLLLATEHPYLDFIW